MSKTSIRSGWTALTSLTFSSLLKPLLGSSSIHARFVRVMTAALLLGAVMFVPHFTDFGNIQGLLYSLAAVGIGAIGMTFITLSGRLFMLSMGATAAVSTVLFASFISYGLGTAMLLVMLCGLAIGATQGWVVAVGKTNPIITTIATSSLIIGTAVMYTEGRTVVGKGDASWLGHGTQFGWLPNQIIVLLIFALVASFILQHLRIGREIRLMGLREEVARIAGLRLVSATLVSYGCAGIAASLAGCLIASSAAQGNLSYGIDLDFNAIAAVLVGGISIRGGRGAVSDALIGALFLATVGNLLLVSGLNYDYQLVAKGAVVVAAVVLGALLAKIDNKNKR